MTSYDDVPYPRFAHRQAHPNRLAVLGTLLGLSVAPVTNCRVLEIACASGDNIIPMALTLPNSEFVGIDLAAQQIAVGQAALAELKLTNLRLETLDLMAITPEFGQFDYIIAHGLYSWIPLEVRDKLLVICKQNLAPNGLAYISYNTYPGWHALGMMREMMLYRTRHISDVTMKVAQAREFLDFMTTTVPQAYKNGAEFLKIYGELLKNKRQWSQDMSDAYLFHDALAEINTPVYFHEFIDHATRHGLQYLTEADFRTVFVQNLPTEISAQVMKMATSLIDAEQYIDFMLERTFRQTILCHQETTVNRQLGLGRVRGLRMASAAQPDSADVNLKSATPVKFKGDHGGVFATDHPLSKAAWLCLREAWPQALTFDEIAQRASARLGLTTPSAMDLQLLEASFLKAYTFGDALVELHYYQPAFVTQVSAKPVGFPWARLQALTEKQVTNLRHEAAELDRFQRYVLMNLDGAHTTTMLLDELMQGPVAAGELEIPGSDGTRETDPVQIRAFLTEELERTLAEFAKLALLVA